MLELREIISLLDDCGVLDSCRGLPYGDIRLLSVTCNSKETAEGALFVCKGSAFKKEYLEEAVRKGAAAAVSEKDYDVAGLPLILVTDIRKAMEKLAGAFYPVPEGEMPLIGITGTKGKTSTAYLIRKILDCHAEHTGAGPAAILTSIEMFNGVRSFPSVNTTPEILDGYRFRREAWQNGAGAMVMEVSSQGLKYGRVAGMTFDIGILLNLSPDHISPIEHPDLEDYYGSKMKLFSQSRHAVFPDQGEYSEQMREAAKNAEIHTFGVSEEADYSITGMEEQDGSTAFRIRTGGETVPFVLGMRGRYNVENAAAAIAACRILGVPLETIKEAVREVSIPGRGEEYSTKDGKIRVIVDYAHNAVSCDHVIRAAKDTWPDRKIVSVFGCPGGKALNRRKGMAEAVSALSDFIILTADDPGPEEVSDICREIAESVKDCEYRIIPDRVEAIRTAFAGIREETVLMLLGKGCETAQKVGGRNVPYASDASVAKQCIEEYDTSQNGDKI